MKCSMLFSLERSLVCTHLDLNDMYKWLFFKGNVYKSYETHEEAILAWVFYEPWWRRLETPSPSPMNQLIRQPCDDKVMRTSKDHL